MTMSKTEEDTCVIETRRRNHVRTFNLGGMREVCRGTWRPTVTCFSLHEEKRKTEGCEICLQDFGYHAYLQGIKLNVENELGYGPHCAVVPVSQPPAGPTKTQQSGQVLIPH